VCGYGVVACPRWGRTLYKQYSIGDGEKLLLPQSYCGVDATNAGRVVVGFDCINGGGLIYVACAGAGEAVLAGSSISVGVYDHMGLSPLTPFLSACCPLFLIGWGVDTRSGGAAVYRVRGCFEIPMLRYGGMPAPCALMGCRKGFPAGFLGRWQLFFCGWWWAPHEAPRGGGCPGGGC